MSNGWIKLHRKIIESEIWTQKPAWWLKVWNYIILKANHSGGSKFKPGENFFTFQRIYADCNLIAEGVKYRSVDNVIRTLKLNAMITTQKTTRGIIIKVCNWERYQGEENSENDEPNANGTTGERHTNDTINKNKELRIKKKKEEKKNIKKKFLDFVFLAEPEHKKLIEKFGSDSAHERIEKLNEYIGSKGVKYSSHYFTILSWDRRDKEKLNPKKRKHQAPQDGPVSGVGKFLFEKQKQQEREVDVSIDPEPTKRIN